MRYVGFSGRDEVADSFNQVLTDEVILFACYEIDGYEGSAFVLFFQNGKLWETTGYHCSCNGLEDCWRPEEVNVDELVQRVNNDPPWGRDISANDKEYLLMMLQLVRDTSVEQLSDTVEFICGLAKGYHG
ncbi:MAG: hypothetical protein ACYSTI_12735 [Planctomycetota bacterium]|jgi:hypothetical protein